MIVQHLSILLAFWLSVVPEAFSEPQNRFVDGGCLHKKKEGWPKIRVCGSEDPPYAAEKGFCRYEDTFDYMELRLHPQNWESTFFRK